MMSFPVYVVVLFCIIPNWVSCFINYGKIEQQPVVGDPGQPLYLTPLIESGKISEAQSLAKVPLLKNQTSYSGYLTVNKEYSSNMFFWFFPATTVDYKQAPVVLWLQGGPGATSLIGLFTENGPFSAMKHGLKPRKYSWTLQHNVIYIDNPVGTGYSFTKGGYAQNQTAVGEDLHNALVQFFKLFPELQKNPFFVTGESYAGKYVPAISYTIHKKNPTAPLKINLQGLSIGNGLSDPEHQLVYSDYLYQLGLIDGNARDIFKQYEQKGVNYIKNQQWEQAFEIFDTLLNGDLNNHKSLFKNVTGFDNYFNYLVSTDPGVSIANMGRYVQEEATRKALHVGSMPFNGMAQDVEKHLVNDVMKSVAPWVSELLSNYRVLIYNGQLDIIVAYPLTINYLNNLDFSAAKEYKTAKRNQWYVGSELAGYVKQAGNLTEVLVRNAGHMVPTDQPKWALDLLSRFVKNKPFPNTSQ